MNEFDIYLEKAKSKKKSKKKSKSCDGPVDIENDGMDKGDVVAFIKEKAAKKKSKKKDD